MNLEAYRYHLPDHLIARYPLKKRSDSRLLCLDKTTGDIQHRQFTDLIDLLTDKDLLVFNDTKVIPARLLGHKSTGGQVEVMLERLLGEHQALVQIRASKPPKSGHVLHLSKNVLAVVLQRQDDFTIIEFDGPESAQQIFERYGEIPLPPYLGRTAEVSDQQTYQTVYAKDIGAVAAPTAGLHFDQATLNAIDVKGIQRAFVTLHVGAGTFLPLREAQIQSGTLHKEWLCVSQSVCDAITRCKEGGGRVIAVGTTSLRALETASQSGRIQPYQGDTQLFIKPGDDFYCVDGLLTNFHLPCSSLLMLVSALGGFNAVKKAYNEAVDKSYRFFSYGDAMIVANFGSTKK